MISIDGSFGEGGGQIVRTSLALSLVTGQPVSLQNIRAGRKKPGLLRQHLTAARAAGEISNAEMEGDRLGSRTLTFKPGAVTAGTYRFAVGSAGSCSLVLQTILPALMLADQRSEITVEGGTHNPFAPPFDFLARAFLPLVSRMGPRVTATLHRHGFYPAGGGMFQMSIQPSRDLTPLELCQRGNLLRTSVQAVVCDLPEQIARREVNVIRRALGLQKADTDIVAISDGSGPGNVVSITVEAEQVTEVFTGFGKRGVPAEAVAKGALREARAYLASDAAVGSHLADQLLIPLALAGGGQFTTPEPTTHTTTNMEVIRKFLDVRIGVKQLERNCWQVNVGRAVV